MDNESNKPTYELREALLKLKTETDALRSITSSTGTNHEQTLATYQSNVLPYLLQLRRLNRMSKDKIEIKHDEVKQLNRKLVNLHDTCENITYEAACLNQEISLAKRRLSPIKSRAAEAQGDLIGKIETNGHSEVSFDAEKVAEFDHKTRLEKLDEEEKKRKKLQDKLIVVTEETNKMDAISKSTEAQLNRVKPYIRQLVERPECSETGPPPPE